MSQLLTSELRIGKLLKTGAHGTHNNCDEQKSYFKCCLILHMKSIRGYTYEQGHVAGKEGE